MQRSDAERARLTQAGLNLIQQALSIYDADLRLAVSNPRFRDMFSLPEHLVTPGAHFEDTIRYLVERGEYGDVTDTERFVSDRVRQARAFEPHYMERTRATGQVISVEGNPLPQGGWVTVYTDISEAKAQEALLRSRSETLSEQLLSHAERLAQSNRELAATITALAEAKRELIETEARTRMTAEMMPAHISHVDRDGIYSYSNKRLSTVLPQSPSEILGLHISTALGPEAYERITPYLDLAFRGEASVFEFTHTPSSRRIRAAFTPDGRSRTSGGGGVYILSMDVTAETQARAALAQTRKRELAAQLTSGMAHDFANLLTIILGLQGQLEQLDLDPAAKELVAGIRAAARRGGDLLDRLASISGPRRMRPAPTDLAALFSDLARMSRPALPAGVRLSTWVEGLDRPVLVDAGSLQDALLNLILNARDAMNGSGEITLTARSTGGIWIEIDVDDGGPGFSDQALRRALDPFYTTKGGEGSGLGLSMAFDFTQLSGGTIKLSNTERGARVRLRLPLREARPPSDGDLILLVEDNADIRASVRRMLIDEGHKVIEAETAEEAAALIDLPGLAMVLSDISLAGEGSGLDLAEQIDAGRTTGDSAGPPVRLMTALPPGDPLRRRAAARFPLIAKPFAAHDLRLFLQKAARP